MPPSDNLPPFLRRSTSPPTPAAAETPDYLADAIADTVVEHLPDAVQARVRDTVRRPLARRVGRALLVVALAAYFLFGALVLLLRYVVMPEIRTYRPQVERLLSKSLQRQVAIGAIDAYWVGLRPALRLTGVALLDARRQPALQLDSVDARLSWDSLAFLQLRLEQLEIRQPALSLRRDSEGRLFVAGLEITPSAGDDNAFGDWLLAQHSVIVRDATLEWQDDLRNAPPLRLQHVDFRLENGWRSHRFGLAADPPADLASRLDIRGDLTGSDLADPDDWRGDLYVDLAKTELAVWQRWIDYPLVLDAGHGGMRAWVKIDGRRLVSASADLRLEDARFRLGANLPALDLQSFAGRVTARRNAGERAVELDNVTLATRDGIRVPPTTGKVRVDTHGGVERVELTASMLDLDVLTQLARHLPLDRAVANGLALRAARGTIADLAAGWTRKGEAVSAWHLNARFSGLGIAAADGTPGAANLSGRIDGDQSSGRLSIDSRDTAIDLPGVFSDGPLRFDELGARVEWAGAEGGRAFHLRQARFANADTAGEAAGTWLPREGGPGVIDLSARLERATATAVARYFPASLPDTKAWLARALRAGQAANARLTLKGDLAQFPFRKPGSGTFEVRADVRGATLDYAEGWPEISDITGELLFAGAGMRISADSGRIVGTSLRKTTAVIADLEMADPLLVINGQASGPTAAYLAFIEASPVGASLDHATRELAADGNAVLDLELRFPLAHMENSAVAGSLRVDDNRLRVDPSLPWLTQVRGTLKFTDKDVSARALSGRLLGMPISADLRSDTNALNIAVKGEINADALRREWDSPLAAGLAGSTRWSGNIRTGPAGTQMSLASDLAGLAVQWPAPFAKAAADKRRLSIERKPVAISQPANYSRGNAAVAAARPPARPDLSLVDVRLADAARLLMLLDPANGNAISRGALVIGRDNAALPDEDFVALVDVPQLDLDFWRRALPTGEVGAGWPPLRFDLTAGQLTVFGKRFDNLRVSGDHAGNLTRVDARGASFAASLAYDSRGQGRLTGNLPRLALTGPVDTIDLAEHDLRPRDVVKQLPAIQVSIDQLSYKGRDLGAMVISAENRSEGSAQWLAQVQLRNREASFDGRLAWLPDEPAAQSQLAFDLQVDHIEKTLARVGYPDAVKRGDARIEGTLLWTGSPVDVDYASLTGGMHLAAGKGQFNKLEPGVGRLLGILSLQSLPRRITLDFRDIFSEGFAFDSIEGDLNVVAGVMRTDDLEVRGPAAKIFMKGEVDLARETQRLNVRVQPALSDTVAIGAMLAANPVAGAIAWAAQKLLADPLDQVFSFNYVVTGAWSDPKVDKLGAEVTPTKADSKSP